VHLFLSVYSFSELHSTIEASAPGANPVPDTLMTSPAATPLQTGVVGLASLHVAPAAVVDSDSVVAVVLTAPDAPVTFTPSMKPPPTTASTPMVANSLEVRLKRPTIAPLIWTGGGGAEWPRPLRGFPDTAYYSTVM